MKPLLQWLLPILLLIGTGHAIAQYQPINFDDVANGTDISTHYTGLTFSCDGTACPQPNPSIVARATPNTASLPNSVAINTAGAGVGMNNATTGRIKIELASPAMRVSIDARSFPLSADTHHPTPQRAVLIAQDSAGMPVGQATGTVSNAFEKLSVSSGGNTISRVFLGVETSGSEAVAQFDNLQIDRGVTAAWFSNRQQMLWVLFGIVTLGMIGGIVAWTRRRP